MTDTRSDFWKCDCSPIAVNVAYDMSRCICCGIHRQQRSQDATPAEILAAWLLAPDDRRRELEIASRPKEHGKYMAYWMPEDFPIRCVEVTVDADITCSNPTHELLRVAGRGLWVRK